MERHRFSHGEEKKVNSLRPQTPHDRKGGKRKNPFLSLKETKKNTSQVAEERLSFPDKKRGREYVRSFCVRERERRGEASAFSTALPEGERLSELRGGKAC